MYTPHSSLLTPLPTLSHNHMPTQLPFMLSIGLKPQASTHSKPIICTDASHTIILIRLTVARSTFRRLGSHTRDGVNRLHAFLAMQSG